MLFLEQAFPGMICSLVVFEIKWNVSLFAEKAARAAGRELCFNEKPSGSFDAAFYAGDEDIDDEGGKGAYGVAGVGYVRDEVGPLSAEAKGPSVGMGIGITKDNVLTVMTKAELASTSFSTGKAKATLGLSADTGASIGPTQVEAKFLGTGVSLGREMGFSVFGSGFKFKLWWTVSSLQTQLLFVIYLLFPQWNIDCIWNLLHLELKPFVMTLWVFPCSASAAFI